MATALDIIKRSLRQIGALEAGGTPSGDEGSDALIALNAMLAQWSIDGLICYSQTTLTEPLVASTASYTIGTGGDIVAEVPLAIEQAYIRDAADSYDYPLAEINSAAYHAISDKASTTEYPDYYFYEPSFPLGRVYIYPVPSTAHTLYLRVKTKFTAFTALTTDVSLPDGYEDAMAYNLAERLSPEYGISSMNPIVSRFARETLASIQVGNKKQVIASFDDALLTGTNGRYNIYIGR